MQTINFCENEKEFFKKILCDFDLRSDGRDRLSIRSFEIKDEIIPSCFSSLKIKLLDTNKEILIAIKGDLVKQENSQIISDIEYISLSLDSMNKIEDIKLKSQMEEYLKKLIIKKLDKNIFYVKSESNEKTDYYWKLTVDIFIFDVIKITLLQIISMGVKKALMNIKLPMLIFFKNEITGLSEYDLVENYKDISENEKEISLDLINIPDILVFSLINNIMYLDPNDEEEAISDSIIIASKKSNSLESIQSIGSSVDLDKIMVITDVIKNLSF